MRAAGYNRRDPMKSSVAKDAGVGWSAGTGCCCVDNRLQSGGTLDAPATELAHQIAALTGPGAVSLTIRNNSSIPASDVPVIRNGAVVGRVGCAIRNQRRADAVAMVRVTLSQSARQGLWVAEVQQGPETRVAMVSCC